MTQVNLQARLLHILEASDPAGERRRDGTMLKGMVTAASLAIAAFPASAVTVSAVLDYEVEDQSLFGPGGPGDGLSDASSVDLEFAEAGYSVAASAGTVDAEARQHLNASYAERIPLGTPANIQLAASAPGSSAGFDAGIEAEANLYFDISPFSVPLLGTFDPPSFDLIDEQFRVGPEASQNDIIVPITTLSATGRQDVAGIGASFEDLGLDLLTDIANLVAQADLEATLTSTLDFGSLSGTLRATHTSGAVSQTAFSLSALETRTLNLPLIGIWDLDLVDVSLANSFSSAFGVSASSTLGIGVGDCGGDLSSDDDNGLLCLFDEGATFPLPTLDFAEIDPFGLEFDLASADIGAIEVYVPLPPGLPLLAIGLGALALFAGRTPMRSAA